MVGKCDFGDGRGMRFGDGREEDESLFQPQTTHCVEPYFVSKRFFKHWHCVERAILGFAIPLPEATVYSRCPASSPSGHIFHVPEQI